MAQFKWDERLFTLVENPLWPEIEWVESQVRKDFNALTGSQQTRALILISLRRGTVMLKWTDLDSTGPGDFEFIEDDEDPTATGAEAGSAEPSPPPVLSGTPANGSPLVAKDVTSKSRPRSSRRPAQRTTSGG